jgi:protein-S-isoprenylcysteine O-methyltransferase Ste14
MTGFLGLWGWAAWKLRALDKYIPIRFPAWLIAPGVVLILEGAALGLATAGLFIIEGRGTPAPFDPPKKFVPRGPYRLVRNPMYVGGIWCCSDSVFTSSPPRLHCSVWQHSY